MPQQDKSHSATRRAAILNDLRQSYGKNRPDLEDRHAPNSERHAVYDFSRHEAYSEVRIAKAAAQTLSLASPFFRVAEDVRSTQLLIDGNWVTNFASYDYLSLNTSSEVRKAAKTRIDEWGVSATASRLVGGERVGHARLEQRLAGFLGAESVLTMVSGHATNMTVIRTLLGQGDLILVDSLAHNSIYEGIRSSGASHVSFPHNDFDWVDEYLAANRSRYKHALIAVEGLYSMDGDAPDLSGFVRVKQRHDAWLMVDEAHSIGVLGATGRGVCEEQGINPQDVELTMGTLSKALCSCGGFIAGSEALTDLLRFKAPGFVYSVGLSTPNAAAAEAAVESIEEHPEYVAELREKSMAFRTVARALGLDTDKCQAFAVCPVIVGDSLRAVWLSNRLLQAGFNVLPIIAPAVPDRSARLRFFLNRHHEESVMRSALEETKRLIDQAASMSARDLATH